MDQQENGKQLSEEELTDLLQAATRSTFEADKFWGSFQYALDIRHRNFSRAEENLLLLMHRCQILDPTAYSVIHKGTPFYFLGTIAFILHDYETALFFFDAAVSEDLRAGVDPQGKGTPAIHFICLDGEQPEQAAQEIVQIAQAQAERTIDRYNNMTGKAAGLPHLKMEDLRERFLRFSLLSGNEHLRTLATTLISFFVEWDFRNEYFDLCPERGTAEPFYLHLLKGCVLFESLLKANRRNPPPIDNNLGQVLQYLHRELGIAHNLRISATLPAIISELPNFDNSIESAIQITGQARNTTGHNLGWLVSLSKSDYQLLFEIISASCLHAINCFY